MKKRIAITAAIALLAILSTMCFAACEQAITADEAMTLLSDSIAEAKAQSGYFVKYKTFFSDGTTEEYRLYVKGIGTESVAAAYDHTVDKVVSTSTEYLYWGAASQVKEDKNAEDVVKTGMLSQAGEGNNKYWVIDDTITLDDFLAKAEVAPYTLDAICAYIEDCLTADKMTITSAKTKGWVDYAFVSEVVAPDERLLFRLAVRPRVHDVEAEIEVFRHIHLVVCLKILVGIEFDTRQKSIE